MLLPQRALAPYSLIRSARTPVSESQDPAAVFVLLRRPREVWQTNLAGRPAPFVVGHAKGSDAVTLPTLAPALAKARAMAFA